jgi:galactokinase
MLSVPGRINLIGEHIDYHQRSVLPMAIQRHIRLTYRARNDRRIHAVSQSQSGRCEFPWTKHLDPGAPGDWSNYVKAAAQLVGDRWNPSLGIDAAVTSDLPAAAGLSSSTALLVALTLALLRANGIRPAFQELMEVLPDGEHFVGTRGGGMDHAVVLGAEAGSALLVNFAPLSVEPVAVPRDWRFLVAHSLVTAKKSGASREAYNAVRARSGAHVAAEADRVQQAVRHLRGGDIHAFGARLLESHASLRGQLGVSIPELDELAGLAMEAGAYGARLTGAGFGGCAIALCDSRTVNQVRDHLATRFYAPRGEIDLADRLFVAEPSAGALT